MQHSQLITVLNVGKSYAFDVDATVVMVDNIVISVTVTRDRQSVIMTERQFRALYPMAENIIESTRTAERYSKEPLV